MISLIPCGFCGGPRAPISNVPATSEVGDKENQMLEVAKVVMEVVVKKMMGMTKKVV